MPCQFVWFIVGIQPIAKKLGIDIVQAMVGWTFHGAGWVHPNFDGFVVCREDIPILMDAWRQARRDQLKAAAEERTQRSISNWQRLVRGLQLWQRVQAQFELVSSAVSTCKPLGAGQKVPQEAKHSTESGRGRRGGKGRVRGSGKSQEASSFIIAAQDQIGKPEAGDLTYFGDSRLHDELTTHGCSKEIEKLEDSEPEAQLDAEEQLHESVQADRKQASGAPPDPITSVLPASSFTQLASHKWRCLDSLMPFGNPADLPTLFPAGQRCSYRQSRARGSCARRGGFSGPCVKRRIRKKRSGSTDSSESVSSTADKENSISSHESDGEWQRPKALPAALTKQDLPRRSSRRCPDRKSAFQKA
ncbi:unnamed protein product [Protopolystoma xenopodis]|uniref:Rad4 beta-hairpin domain-containing protein n=1 Tax=Protopolystoma xenopodis TaxID=117903 RepID=A0A3S5B0G3_9PLAT|nr:unnamed protein product [Protopolystoma xenopodis]